MERDDNAGEGRGVLWIERAELVMIIMIILL